MKPWLYTCALLGLGLVLAAGLGETGLRLYVWLQTPPQQPTATETPQKLMRKERRTGWLPEEGVRIERTDPYGNPFTIRINSTAQRGETVPPRRPGERRILFLGDSYTMASQIREEETFVARTGHLLAEQIPAVAINGGVNGYGTYQEMAYYRHYGRPLEADLVVLAFFVGNDFRDNMVMTRQGRGLNPVYVNQPQRFIRQEELLLRSDNGRPLKDPISGEVMPKPALGWIAALERHALLGRLLGARLAKLRGRLTGNMDLIDLDHRYYFYEIGFYQGRADGLFSTSRELTLECLHLLRQRVHWDGAELAVVLLPSPNQVAPALWRQTLDELRIDEEDLGPLDFDYPNRIIRDFCTDADVPYLDLTATFAEADDPTDLFLTVFGDGHLSPAGHELVAAELARFLPARTRALSDPANPVYWSIRYAMRERRWQDAGRQLQEALEQSDWPMLYLALGDYYRFQGALEHAADAYRQTLARDEGILPAWEGLGRTLGELGDAAGALNAWREARRLQPNWWPYYLEFGRQYRTLGRSDAEAVAQIERVFAADPLLKELWWDEHISRGALMLLRRRFAAAEREFQWAGRFMPDDPVAFYNLGWLYQQTGRPARARDQYQKALAVAPDFGPARQRLAGLQ